MAIWEILFAKDLAMATVLSSDFPSTIITSKSLNDWFDKSLSKLGKYFSSLRVGMTMEKYGF